MQGNSLRGPIADMLSEPIGAVALQDCDENSLRNSASGGAFAVLARAVLAGGGAVFGSALLEDGSVRHVCIRDVSALPMLQGSKYVRSDVVETYEECARLLKDGEEVLYSGTPCQIAALRNYLGKRVTTSETDKYLICVDLICHGTPRQELFSAYLEWLSSEKKTDDGIHGYVFRSKKMGWGLYYYYYYYYRHGRRHEVLGPARDDPYFSAFSKGIIYRKGCYKCPFARLERVGDITIGDYWGIEEVHPGFFDKRGVSAVLFNTEKGETFFNGRCATECRWLKSAPVDVAAYNTNLVEPASRTSADEMLADEVERAVDAGDYARAYGELLAPKKTMLAKIRGALPWRFVRFITRFKS